MPLDGQRRRKTLAEDPGSTRHAPVGQQFGAPFPGMVQNTTEILFRDLWLRPDRLSWRHPSECFGALSDRDWAAEMRSPCASPFETAES